MKRQFYGFFVFLVGLFDVFCIIGHISKAYDPGDSSSDLYIFLDPKKGFYFGIIGSVVFTTLFILMCYYYYKKRRMRVVWICISTVIAFFLMMYTYHYLTGFAEFYV